MRSSALLVALGGGLVTLMALASTPAPAVQAPGSDRSQSKTAPDRAAKSVEPVQDRLTGSLVLSGVVVDPARKPISDVEVVVAARAPADGAVPTLARTLTDKEGAFRLEIDRQRLMGIGRFLWAYRPGRTVAFERVDLSAAATPPIRLTLAEPLKRTVTILDPEGRPVAGVRLAPVLHAHSERPPPLTTPDDRLERMTVVTDAEGVATLAYLPSTIEPLTVRVSAPGLVPHDLPLPYHPVTERFTLKLGRPARLTGSVFYDSGQPAANVVVEVWMANPYYSWSGEQVQSWPTLIHFDSGPVRTGPDGTFQTPQQLVTGSSYRLIIRGEAGSVVSSDVLPATSELLTAPPLRLRQRRRLVGLVHDRRGEPVAGARVFVPSGSPATTTDAQGRFLLEGILPDRTYLLVDGEGFRFQGFPAVPARQPEERKLILLRASEPPDRIMAPQPALISVEEARALARRVLEPQLQTVLAKGDDNSRWDCLRLLSRIDPARTLELVETQRFQDPSLDASLRFRIAVELLAADPVEAESVIAAIPVPDLRASGYVWLAEAVPAGERDRIRGLLERATVSAHAPAGAGRVIDTQDRLPELARVARGWLDFGEAEQARPLIDEGLKILAVLSPRDRYRPNFVSAAARLELDRVLTLIKDLKSASRRTCYVAIAVALANDRPAEAERVYQLIDDLPDVPSYERKNEVVLRLCLPMAKTDSERARRLIAGLKIPREQACAWALVALGLADRDKPAARSALAESIRLIDRLGVLPTTADRMTLPVYVALNPAASILPIVEKVAPERLEEVFWKAVALMPKDDVARERGIVNFRALDATIFLARYDRQVADVFFTQATASQVSGAGRTLWIAVRAKAVIDPRVAVALFEALPRVGPNQGRMARLRDEAFDDLITALLQPIDEHWKDVWRRSGITIDRPRFP